MTTLEALRARSRSLGVSGICGSVLIGYALGLLALALRFPSFRCAASTAPVVLALGISVAMLGDERPSRPRRVAVRLLGGLVVLLAVACTLVPSLPGLCLHAPRAAVALVAGSFVLLAAALVSHDLDAGPFPVRVRDGLLAAPAILSLVIVAAVLTAGESMQRTARAALLGAGVGIGLSCLAMLTARPNRGFMRFVTSDGATGRFVRAALPAAILVPIAFGVARRMTERAGHALSGLAPALQALLEIACLSGVVIWNARGLQRAVDGGRRTVERLRESEQALRVTLDSIGHGVIVMDAGGRVMRVTPAATRCTGYERARVLGRRFDAVFRAIDLATGAPAESPFDHVARVGNALAIAERTLLLDADGAPRAIVRSGAPVLSTLGILRGVVLVLGDPPPSTSLDEAARITRSE